MARPEEPTDIVWDERQKADISLYGRDRGTRERWRQSKLVEIGSRRGTGRHAEDQEGCPLERYYRRLNLSDSPYREKRGEENERRHEAALRFLADWEKGGRRPRMVARLDGAVTTSGRWHGSSGAAWAPWAEAYMAMDRWASCVQSVVCFDETAKRWAERHTRVGSAALVGMMALRLGLEKLVEWYACVDKAGRRR